MRASGGRSRRRWRRESLRAVVCTSTLDLGIDWGDVDLVVHIGAPKGAAGSRKGSGARTIGSTSHRSAVLVPANRFEVIECRVALDANYLGAQDTPPIQPGALDVLAQHVLGVACSAPVRCRRTVCRGPVSLSLPRPRPADVRPCRRLRRDRRLCAPELRALRQDQAGRRRAVAHHPSARRPAVPAERRHDHRGAAPQRPRRAHRGGGLFRPRRAGARQDRGELHRSAVAPATPSSSPASSSASRGSARTR